MLSIVACGPDRAARRTALVAELRADSNRDGEVRFDDDSDGNKTGWNEAVGAVFLANIDDDGARCEPTRSDLTIALCNDAQDEIVNGDDDARDLARLKTRPWPEAPADTTARVIVATTAAKDLVRLFRRTGPGASDFEAITDESVFPREQVAAGLELAIEGKDIVRDAAKWDGYLDIQLRITSTTFGEKMDVVRMRLAPVLMYHHLLPTETVWVPRAPTAAFRAVQDQVAASCAAAGIAPPRELPAIDQWGQDYFEPAFMSMPGPGGTQHVMHVNYRSANVYAATDDETPLRPAGQVVFKFRGKDVAGVQQFDRDHSPEMDTLDSTGNFETVPPYEKDGISFPFGRILRGASKSFHPDKSFTRMLDSQMLQPPLEIDTSWLWVAHVDETISFVKAPTPRGWVLLANDPRLAKEMLEDAVAAGAGDVPMFVGKTWIDLQTRVSSPAEITIKRVLEDETVMEASAEAAAEVDAQLAILKQEIGLSDDEIIRVPFLHTIYSGRLVAYQPGMVNGLYVSQSRFAAPDPHGPEIGGKDIFKVAFSEALAKLGITVDFIDNWDTYHRFNGEVHCGSNVTRSIPEVRWWETGR